MDKFPETVDDFLTGQILLINKPLGWTSFDVVKKIKNLIRTKYSLKKIKVGHAGTLDPLASGLLIVCTGKFTKRISELQGQEKTYTGDITLGGTTPSYDLETEVDKLFETSHITDELIKETTHQFTGEIYQKPPIFSALKRGGERLYKKARSGEIKNFTGIDSPYEIPESPSLIVDTEKEDVEHSVEKIYSAIKSKIK